MKANLTLGSILRTLGVLACTALLAHAQAEEPQPHVFSDTEGRSFAGEMLDFDPETETVTIRRVDNRRKADVELSVFSEADRLYIRDWAVSNSFVNGVKVDAQLKSGDAPAHDSGGSATNGRVFESLYAVELSNTSGFVFEPVEVEYCIYYRQGERKGAKVVYDEGISHGQGSLLPLEPEGSASFNTRKVRLRVEVQGQSAFGAAQLTGAEIRGLWLRIKTMLPSGAELVRDFRTSDDPEWVWRPQSFGVGLNKGDTPPASRTKPLPTLVRPR